MPPGKGRWQPPRQASDRAKALGRSGLSGPLARAVVAGLLRFPEVIAPHSGSIHDLPITDKRWRECSESELADDRRKRQPSGLVSVVDLHPSGGQPCQFGLKTLPWYCRSFHPIALEKNPAPTKSRKREKNAVP